MRAVSRETIAPVPGALRRPLRLSAARLSLLLALIGIASLGGAVVLRYERGAHLGARATDAQTVAAAQAANAAGAIGALLADAQQTGDDIVRRLNAGEITPEDAPAAIRTTLEAHPLFWGLGVTYDPRVPTAPLEPNHYDTRPGGQIHEGRIPYDYTDPEEPRSHWWRQGYEVGST